MTIILSCHPLHQQNEANQFYYAHLSVQLFYLFMFFPVHRFLPFLSLDSFNHVHMELLVKNLRPNILPDDTWRNTGFEFSCRGSFIEGDCATQLKRQIDHMSFTSAIVNLSEWCMRRGA